VLAIVNAHAFVDSKLIGVPLFNFPPLFLFDEWQRVRSVTIHLVGGAKNTGGFLGAWTVILQHPFATFTCDSLENVSKVLDG
jgi:hypothetical protein